MRRTPATIIGIITLLILVGYETARAQTQDATKAPGVNKEEEKNTATIEETTEWIRKTISLQKYRQPISFEGYLVSGRWLLTKDAYAAVLLVSAKFDLKEVIEVRIEECQFHPGDKTATRERYAQVMNTPPFLVILVTKDKVPVWVDAPGLTEFRIAMPDREIAERVQAAFKHAVELAKKQKKEPF
jgi:hypothetical protein